jgi:hypothetical protein
LASHRQVAEFECCFASRPSRNASFDSLTARAEEFLGEDKEAIAH